MDRSLDPISFSSTSTCAIAFLALRVGDRVNVIGFSNATIIRNEPHNTNSTNRLHVRYDDGSTYYCKRETLRPLESLNLGLPTEDHLVRPLLEHRGEAPTKFDEYHCAEKIDFEALKRIRQDLQKDSTTRNECFQYYRGKVFRGSETNSENFKKLQKCQLFEAVVECLHEMLKEIPVDNSGYVVHEVEYEQRDPSFRGRLFAKGKLVQMGNDEYPRSATLQGMHKDLRAPLVGKFAHDIDCENSEVRLICSLASQYDLTSLIPTLIDYRDNREHWLRIIQNYHSVSKSDAKGKRTPTHNSEWRKIRNMVAQFEGLDRQRCYQGECR